MQDDLTACRPFGLPGHHAGETYALDVPTSAEVEAILAACNRGATGDRLRALVTVLYRCGLRISEAVGAEPRPATAGSAARLGKPGLRMADYDPASRRITVQKDNAKGSRRTLDSPLVAHARVVPLDVAGAAILERWLDRRKKAGLTFSQPMFCQLDGSPWSPQHVRRAITRAAEKAGLEGRFNPHAFRHACAVRMDEAGVRTSLIQAQLGHADLSITTRYLAGIKADEDLAVAVESVAW